MKYKTVTEEIYEEGLAAGLAKVVRNMLNMGLTDEQIITATGQPIEAIAAFRREITNNQRGGLATFRDNKL